MFTIDRNMKPYDYGFVKIIKMLKKYIFISNYCDINHLVFYSILNQKKKKKPDILRAINNLVYIPKAKKKNHYNYKKKKEQVELDYYREVILSCFFPL